MDNPIFKPPENPNTFIWRYMSIAKFINILDKESLFFPKLTTLSDRHEGYLNDATIRAMLQQIEGDTAEEIGRNSEKIKHSLQVSKSLRNRIAVCSWHINDSESVAMWNVYTGNNDGIALKTTYDKLKHCFDKTKDRINIGMIQYYDNSRDLFGSLEILGYGMIKRKIFNYENELRAVVVPVLPMMDDGVYIKADLNILIDSIIVSPNCQSWLLEITNNLLSKYNLNKPVSKSVVDDDPPY